MFNDDKKLAATEKNLTKKYESCRITIYADAGSKKMSHLLVTRLRLRQRPKIMGPTVCDKNANHPDAKVQNTSTLPFFFRHTLAFLSL